MSYLTSDWLMQDLQGLTRRTSPKAGTGGGSRQYDVSWQGEDYNIWAPDLDTNYENLMTKGYAPQSFGEFAKGIYNPEGGKGRHEGIWKYGGEEFDMKRSWTQGKKQEVQELEGALRGMYKEYLRDVKAGTGPKATGQMSGATIFDREGYVGDISTARGVDAPPASSFTQFTPEMFKKLRTEAYQPEIEESRGSLVDDLIVKQRRAGAQGSGLAGYGRRQSELEGAQADFGKGVEGIYADVEDKRAGSLQEIYDVMSQYETGISS